MIQVIGTLEALALEPAGLYGTVNVKGARMRVPLYCVPDARLGDRILVDAGVAVSIIEERSGGVDTTDTDQE